jgi:hypothetical protein
MTKAKYFTRCCAVSVSILFFWALLIGACSWNQVIPAQADKSDASSQGAATPAQAGKHIAMVECSKSDELLKWQEDMELKKDKLYLYAVKLFNKPVACKGNYDGDIIVFTFANGPTFKLTSNTVALRAPGGFPNEEEARSIIKQYTEGHLKGIEMNWAKPDEGREGDEQVYTYWAKGEGLNVGADMVYKDKKLVEICYHSVD